MTIKTWNPSMTDAETKDLAYWERNMLALRYADGWYNDDIGDGELPYQPRYPGWRRVLSLDGGKMTFHIPDEFDVGLLAKIKPNWDGHTTEQKWRRVAEYRGIKALTETEKAMGVCEDCAQPEQVLTTGDPVPADRSHTEIDPKTGQQKGYVVLSPEERAKGFVRPLRLSYRHVGRPLPGTLRNLTLEETERYKEFGYVKFEPYGEDRSPVTGRFWTQADLDRVGKGCGTVTSMSLAIAETYARNPKFYGGTFCTKCRTHLPLEEFLWEGTNEIVGS